MLAVTQFLAGCLDNGVYAALGVIIGDTDGVVGGNTILCALPVAVVDGTGREAYAPATGQLAAEGHAGSSPGLVAHGDDLRTAAHVLDKLVGSAEYGPVGEYGHRLVPSQPVARAQPLLLER